MAESEELFLVDNSPDMSLVDEETNNVSGEVYQVIDVCLLNLSYFSKISNNFCNILLTY